MGLLDGDIAEIFHSAFSGIYLDAQLHRPTLTFNSTGGGTETFPASGEPVKAMFARTTEAMRTSDGYVDTDQRILVLSHGITAIDTDCEITLGGQRWSIANVSQDPARSYFDLHGRRCNAQAS